MTLRIRRARAADLGTICRFRRQRTAWLAAQGSDQWTSAGGGLPIRAFAQVVGEAVRAGETWMAEIGGEAAGTVTVNHRADEGLWSPGELADAVIVHYMIVDVRFAGQRVGAALLAHAAALARARHRAWVRLDAWTTNTGLHDYYHRAGFRLARIAAPAVSGPSGAMFERRADSWASTGTVTTTPRTVTTTPHGDTTTAPSGGTLAASCGAAPTGRDPASADATAADRAPAQAGGR